MTSIYLDNNASTAVDQRVLEQMLPYFTEKYGNPSSEHAFGWIAEKAIEKARQQLADLIQCEPRELIFTSGATESINMAIKGVFQLYKNVGKKILVAATEHKAVLETCFSLESQGAEVVLIPVDHEGIVDLNFLRTALDNQCILVCVAKANNETGTIQPVEQIGELCRNNKTLFFCDGTQGPGKLLMDVKEENIDLLCLSAHKMYGPKGIGVIYASRRSPRIMLPALMHGGGQENGMRSGTLNVPSIVGFGKAAELVQDEWFENASKMSRLRTFLEHSFEAEKMIIINGSIKNRLCNTSNIRFPVIKATELIKLVPELAFSTGSACSSSQNKDSHVLTAMGLHSEEIKSSLRISLGNNNTQDEIEQAVLLLKNAVRRINALPKA
jgi:cysteine desulfurase